MLYYVDVEKRARKAQKMLLNLEALHMMKKNGMNRWIRTTALTLAAALTFSGTANTFAQTMSADEIVKASYSTALPVLSVATVDRSMKLAEKALEEVKPAKAAAAEKAEKTENTENTEASKSEEKKTNKPASSTVKKETNTNNTSNSSNKTNKTEKTEKTESKKNNTSSTNSTNSAGKAESSKKPASQKPASSSQKPAAQKPAGNNGAALKNNGCEIDTSKASSGTIRVRQNGNPTKVKVLVYFNGSSKYYQYTIPTNNTWTSIPLQSGSGTYKVRFMKQVNGNSYSQMYSVTFQVGMQNANSAYLNPSQYVVYNSGSACVAKAKSLVAGAGSDAQKVSKIYSYIVNNISYDYDKMKNLPSGYLPNPDSTLSSRKGICFDYAALMAAMLRSQGVACKLVIGNADGQYHAWNMVYVNGGWQLYDPTFGAAGQRASSYVAERVY